MGSTALREHETSRHPGHPHKVVTHMMQARFEELRTPIPAQGVLRIGVIVRIVEHLTVYVRASSGLGFDV